MGKLLILLFVTLCEFNHMITSQNFRCQNPNNNYGYCIGIRECPSIIQILQKQPEDADTKKFVIASQCKNGYGKSPHVCCTEDQGFNLITPTTTTTQRIRPTSQTNKGANLLPIPPECGTESLTHKIYSGNDTALDEFPWMVLIEYRNRSGDLSLSCGGTLINQRYVLTAAHCVVGDILKSGDQPVVVRFGEYDISKDLDCVQGDCADPIIQIGIESIHEHKSFNPYEPQGGNDIALIRLSQDVPFSDFVKPICMPSAVKLQRSSTGDDVVVAGWGRTLTSRQSKIKQKLTIPIFDQNKCVEQYNRKKVTITDKQLCAGGIYKQDSCDGDSGGPLMKHNKFWAIEGIVSFGNRCGLEGWPGIYTRVSEYEDWIKQNIKP